MSQIQTEGHIGKSLGLFDLVDRILDKGLVIDAYISVSIVGIELLVIRARIVVASVETFLRYSAAMGLYGEPGGVLQRRENRENGRLRQQQQQPQLQQQQRQQPVQQPVQQPEQQQLQLQNLLQQLQGPLQQLAQQPAQQQPIRQQQNSY
jgi:hypothetical protein